MAATVHFAVRTMTPYDDQNIFAKILRGEIPCYKVYENRHTLAFLDIMPRCAGHTLVIPKAAARGILDIAADDFAEVARTAKKIAVAAVKGVRFGRHHHSAVQRGRQRAGRVPPAHACDADEDGRRSIAAAIPQRGGKSAGRSYRKDGCRAEGLIASENPAASRPARGKRQTPR
jgi:diadenosine tetraphosphate (Ap4A) HIT family hydrolase